MKLVIRGLNGSLAPSASSGKVKPLQEVMTIDEKQTPKLKPGTIETLLHQLEIQRVNRPEWIARYFPGIEERGRVTYEEVVDLKPREADALRSLLTEQYLYTNKQMCKNRARSVSFLEKDHEEPTGNHWSIRLLLLREAIEDLCSVYGFLNPLNESRLAVH